jgi:hypothetical protein
MTTELPKARLKRELRRLYHSMDFVSRHPVLRDGHRRGQGTKLAEIYQQLGLAWEFLGLRCRHWDGYGRVAEGKQACRICGKIRGADERWLLLPREGRKVIGRKSVPTSGKVFPKQKTARLLSDAIVFHGAKLSVEVQNAYCSSLPGFDQDITIAADRMVRLTEDDIVCSLDASLISVELRGRRPKRGLPYSAFLWELPRKRLKAFPVMLEYDRRGRFVGITIFKPARSRTMRRPRLSTQQSLNR